jgi:hypothetical protein
MAVSKRLRFEILRRDNHTCRYCGLHAPEVALRVDHVVPVALGGSDEPGNLVTACEPCNSGKTSVAPDQPIVDDVAADALRWANAMKAAVLVMSAERERRTEYVLSSGDFWNEYGIGTPPDDAQNTFAQFYDAGLPIEELHDAVLVSTTSRASWDGKWRYFCGVCYQKLSKMREIASDLLEKESIDDGE